MNGSTFPPTATKKAGYNSLSIACEYLSLCDGLFRKKKSASTSTIGSKKLILNQNTTDKDGNDMS